jgi:hypothetical protein
VRARFTPAEQYASTPAFRDDIKRPLANQCYRWPRVQKMSPLSLKNDVAFQLAKEIVNSNSGTTITDAAVPPPPPSSQAVGHAATKAGQATAPVPTPVLQVPTTAQQHLPSPQQPPPSFQQPPRLLLATATARQPLLLPESAVAPLQGDAVTAYLASVIQLSTPSLPAIAPADSPTLPSPTLPDPQLAATTTASFMPFSKPTTVRPPPKLVKPKPTIQMKIGFPRVSKTVAGNEDEDAGPATNRRSAQNHDSVPVLVDEPFMFADSGAPHVRCGRANINNNNIHQPAPAPMPVPRVRKRRAVEDSDEDHAVTDKDAAVTPPPSRQLACPRQLVPPTANSRLADRIKEFHMVCSRIYDDETLVFRVGKHFIKADIQDQVVVINFLLKFFFDEQNNTSPRYSAAAAELEKFVVENSVTGNAQFDKKGIYRVLPLADVQAWSFTCGLGSSVIETVAQLMDDWWAGKSFICSKGIDVPVGWMTSRGLALGNRTELRVQRYTALSINRSIDTFG